MKLILNNEYKINDFAGGVSLNEAIDGVAYTASIKLIETDTLKLINIRKGMPITVIDEDFETKVPKQVFNGLIWELNRSRKSKDLSLTCKERTVYIEESEDEYLFPEGMTATQRIQKYCTDWSIPTAWLVDTQIKLSKAVYRSQSILDMMLKDLKETAQKGGNLYNLRMIDKLNILQLGSNKTVWKLESIAEDIDEKSSLENMVTQVKVLGKQEEDKKTPIIGVYTEDTSKYNYGTIQKIVQDEKIKSVDEAKKRSQTLFSTGEETVKVSGIDINTIRTGDKVSLNGVFLYVINATHNLGSTGRMNLTLGGLDYMRRKFYSGDI